MSLNIDLSYRPVTYWPESLDQNALISRIQGKARRDIARGILADEGFSGLTAFLAREDLDDIDRTMWGKVHPHCMGGEYLPGLDDSGVEIVRISLNSTTCDQISVRAKKVGELIVCSVVDEYETEYQLHIEESRQPLTLGELVHLLDETCNPFSEYSGEGLVKSHWYFLYEYSGDTKEAISFVTLESAFYPDLSNYYADQASTWETEQSRKYKEECEIE